MQDLLNNPAVQGGLAPFVVALAVAFALFSLRLAGLAIAWLGWLWIDPVASLIVAGLIFLAGADLMRDSVTMALAGVPRGIDPDAVEAHLLARPGGGAQRA